MKTPCPLSGHYADVLGASGTLSARAPKGLRASLKGVACLVAIAIGITLLLPMQVADGGSVKPIHPKRYIKFNYTHKQAICLIKLYGKESAFNPRAIGNLDGTHRVYGIPQLKNPIIKNMDAISQLNYGFKYIDHRYNGLPCKAWQHWLDKGWH